MHDSETSQVILIIDDYPENLRILTNILSKAGYNVRAARDGQIALNSLQNYLPDLILLDILMPDLDGYQVCQHLKADVTTRDIPVIFISALQEIPDKIRAFGAGGVDYITKPFQEAEVLARVKTHLEIRNLHRRLQAQNALLQAQNARFHALEEATFEAIVIHDNAGILEVNRRVEELFGYARTDLVGRSPLTLIAPDCREVAARHLQAEEAVSYTLDGLRQDGTVFPVELQTSTIPWQGREEVRVLVIRDLSRQKQLEHENLALKTTLKDRYRFGPLVGKSPSMQNVYELIAKAAATDYGVFVYGESGTGKELVANTIHSLSSRGNQAFVPVNCGAVTETLFEREFFGHRRGAFTGATQDQPGYLAAAHGGTLFLDEVAELSHKMQVKLLRVLDSGGYTPVGSTIVKQANVRIIAATNQDLQALQRQGRIRTDFFYRIHVIRITIAPLRERREDIPLLIEHLLQQESPEQPPPTLPVQVIARLTREAWPGNVRQLRNTIQQYLTTGELLVPGEPQPHTNEAVEASSGLLEAVEQFEKQVIIRALEHNQGNKSATATMLQITRRALYNKLNKYDITL